MTFDLSNKPIVLLLLDNKNQHATLLKIGDEENMKDTYDVHSALLTTIDPSGQVIWLDLSADVWALTDAQQQAVVQYILDYTLSGVTHQLAYAIANDQKTVAVEKLHQMINVQSERIN